MNLFSTTGSEKTLEVITLLALVAVSLLISATLVEWGPLPIAALGGGLVLAFIAFRSNESVLTILLILALALGSCYRWDIAAQTFYVRFFLLGLITIRGLLLFFEAKRSTTIHLEQRRTLLHILFFTVTIMGFITTISSVDRWISFQRSMSFFLLFFVIYVYFWIRANDTEACKRYFASYWWCFIIVSGIGYLFLLGHLPGMIRGGRLRLVLGNPNQLGHYAAMSLPVAIWVLLDKPLRIPKNLAWGVLSVIVISLIWSGSRGAIVTAIVTLLVQFTLSYRKHLILLTGIAILVLSIHFLIGKTVEQSDNNSSFLREHIVRSESLQTGSGRTLIWDAAWRLVKQRPFLGHGFAITDQLFIKGYFPEIPEFQGAHVHNGYLEELVNMGYLGAAPLYFSFLFILIFGAFRLIFPLQTTGSYRLAVALFATIVAGLISGMFEAWFTSVGSIFCFPFWLSAMLFVKVSTSFCDWKSA